MAQRGLEQAPGAGSVREVVRPMVAQGKAHPLAGDTQVPLGGADGVGGAEGVGVEVGSGGEVAGDGGVGERWRDVAASVLEKRDQVVGGVADRGALEVEDADAAEAGAIGQPYQVAGEEVSMDEAARVFGQGAEGRVEGGGEVGTGGGRGGGGERGGPPPVEQGALSCVRHGRRVPGGEVRRRRGSLDGDHGVDGGGEEGGLEGDVLVAKVGVLLLKAEGLVVMAGLDPATCARTIGGRWPGQARP